MFVIHCYQSFRTDYHAGFAKFFESDRILAIFLAYVRLFWLDSRKFNFELLFDAVDQVYLDMSRFQIVFQNWFN